MGGPGGVGVLLRPFDRAGRSLAPSPIGNLEQTRRERTSAMSLEGGSRPHLEAMSAKGGKQTSSRGGGTAPRGPRPDARVFGAEKPQRSKATGK